MLYNTSTLQSCNSTSSSMTYEAIVPSGPFTLPSIQCKLPPQGTSLSAGITTYRDPIISNPAIPFSSTYQVHVEMATGERKQTYRRLSHSKIEKRRKERINDKIDQLKYLIPSCCPSSTTLLPASMHQPLHKLTVLQASIEYIHRLHAQLLQHSSVIQMQHRDLTLTRIIAHAHQLQQNDRPTP